MTNHSHSSSSFHILPSFPMLITRSPRLALLLAVILAVSLPLATSLEPRSRHCLSLLIFSSILWIFEPIPPFVTSLLILPLSIILGIFEVNTAVSTFFDPVIILFISTFLMAHALDKYHISRFVASRFLVTSHLSISILCIVTSAMISNVAASVLVTSMIVGSKKSSSKRTLLTIAFACNFGGMILPIASPQNLIAMASLEGDHTITFFKWLSFSLPICIVGITSIYFVLKRSLSLVSSRDEEDIELSAGLGSKSSPQPSPRSSIHSGSLTKFTTRDQKFVAVVVIVTVFGWITFDWFFANIFIHLGIWGIFCMSILFVFGYLDQQDWITGIPWHLVALLGGGLVLGEAVKTTVLSQPSFTLDSTNRSSWEIFALILLVISIIANFLSSTVCSLVAMPIVARIGAAVGHPELYVMAAAMMTSGAMSLPVSSFPNANAAAVSNELSSRDFIRTGGPITIIVWLTLITFGYFYGLVLGL